MPSGVTIVNSCTHGYNVRSAGIVHSAHRCVQWCAVRAGCCESLELLDSTIILLV